MRYRRVGASGIELPVISLGLWQNFGDDRPLAGMRATLRRAFDLGITHFGLATTTAHPTAPPRPTSSYLRRGFSALPQRADHFDEGGLHDQWPGS